MSRILLAAVSGVLFALAFPDYSIGWLSFVAMAPLLVAVVRSRSAFEAALLGWISQGIAWMMMVPWVIRVMSHYGGLPFATAIVLFVALSALLGLYGAAFALIVYRLLPASRRPSVGWWLVVPLAWAALEYARTYLLTGFPWNLIAASLVDYTSFIQFDRVGGPYLIGAMAMVPAVVIAWLIVARPRVPTASIAIASVVAFLFIWWATGLVASRLIAAPTGLPPQQAALLQPNISQEMRWNDQNLVDIYDRMMRMTAGAVSSGAKIVIWPESTVPLSFARTDFFRESIQNISRTYQADIILGSIAEDPAQSNKMWNAAFLVSSGKTIGHYDKIRLVPFGEYVPLRKMLFFAKKLVHAVGDFEFGMNDRPLHGRLLYGPAICYEIVFPRITATQVRHGADVLVTITNDDWFRGGSAPRQHLNQARLRAIEDDRWLLRAATTGISAVVDPTGTVVQEIPMGQEGTIFASFYPQTTITPYVRFGDWFAWLACFAVIIAVVRRTK